MVGLCWTIYGIRGKNRFLYTEFAQARKRFGNETSGNRIFLRWIEGRYRQDVTRIT
jgi:hypothetical protein